MNFPKTCRALALAAMTLAFASPTLAQTMYRCGSVYQDHPCAGAQAGKVVRNYGGAPAAASSNGDGECKERGARSQKVVWAREAGASAERQLADARTADERNLIAEVYRKRGSAPEVSAAIEADCVTAKQQAAQAAALLSAAGFKGGPAAIPSVAVQPARSAADEQADQAAATARNQQQLAAREAESKKQRCDAIRSRREDVLSRQRAGASPAQAESLNRSRQDIDREMTKGGC